MKFRFTAHALEQLERRGLDRILVERVLENPEQVREQRLGREALQSRYTFPTESICCARSSIAAQIRRTS